MPSVHSSHAPLPYEARANQVLDGVGDVIVTVTESDTRSAAKTARFIAIACSHYPALKFVCEKLVTNPDDVEARCMGRAEIESINKGE